MFKPLPLRVLLANCPLKCQTFGYRVGNPLPCSPQSIVGFSPRACSYHTTVRVNEQQESSRPNSRKIRGKKCTMSGNLAHKLEFPESFKIVLDTSTQKTSPNHDNQHDKQTFWRKFLETPNKYHGLISAVATVVLVVLAWFSYCLSADAFKFGQVNLTNKLYQEYTKMKDDLTRLMDLKKEFFVFLEEKEKKEKKDAVSDPGTKTKDPDRISQDQTDHEKKLNEFVHEEMDHGKRKDFQQWYLDNIYKTSASEGAQSTDQAKSNKKREDIENTVRQVGHFAQRIVILVESGLLNKELIGKLVSKPTILPRAVEIADAILTDSSYREENAVREIEDSFADFYALSKEMEAMEERKKRERKAKKNRTSFCASRISKTKE